MNRTHVIEVELPDGVDIADDDIDVLRTTFQTIITLAAGGCGRSDPHLTRMRDNQWAVNWGLTWIARAPRGSDYEEATGTTLLEVLAQLDCLTSLHEVEGCP